MKRVDGLRHLQLISTYIFRDFNRFCSENQIKVYLHGGTLIGALRHKGFIPWDDDIDVCMSRTDYDKAFRLSGGKISEKCTLIDPMSNSQFNGYIPVVVYNNSKMVSKQYRQKEDLKIGISIFVYDGVPANRVVRALYFFRMYILRAKHALCRANFEGVNTTSAKVFGPLLQRFYKASNTGKYKSKILKLQKKYDYTKSKFVSTNADYKSSKEVCSKEQFEQAVPVVFEGIESLTYSHYDSHLRKYYGDYMQLPPTDKQKPKHGFEAYIEEEFDYSE